MVHPAPPSVLADLEHELDCLGERGHPVRRARPSHRGTRALEARMGTRQRNARALFARAQAMTEAMLEASYQRQDALVVAREDQSLPGGGKGFTSRLLIWAPGVGFGYLGWEGGRYRMLESYLTPESLAEGSVPLRLLATAARNLSAADAGERLVRLQENTRRIQRWALEALPREVCGSDPLLEEL